MWEKFPLNQLRELLKEAKKADRDCRQFGANTHRYQWNPPAILEDVETFEEEIGVKLPVEYRNFLLCAGDGGAGPFYGLFSLKEVRKWLSWKVQTEKEPWFYPGIEIPQKEDEEEGEEDGEAWEQRWEECRRGCIPIGSQGDTYFTYLLVTGPNKGRVVYVEDELSYIFFPEEDSFLSWYTRWLREVAKNYHIFWFGTNLDGDEEELRRRYEEAAAEEKRKLAFSSMRKFPTLSRETEKWILEKAQDYVHEPDARMVLELLWKVSPDMKDDFMERRWEAGLYDSVVSEIYHSIHVLHQEEGEVLERWGRRILQVMPGISQERWYTAFQLLSACPRLKLKDVAGLWDVAEPDSKPELIRAFGRFPDASEHMEVFLEALEEREDLKILNGAVLGVPVVRDERLLASLERICEEFPYSMEQVAVTDWDDEEQVARWERRRDEYTVCHSADIVLERVRETFINPKVPGVPRPCRILLQVGVRHDLGIDRPHEPGGIGVHPFVALVIQEMIGKIPATAAEWDRVFDTTETLSLRPEDRYRCSGGSSHWLYMIPPDPRCTLPEPYYYDIHDWSVIGRMNSLRTLIIERLCVDDFSFLEKCKQVETLSLYNTNFSDCRLLRGMKNLQKVNLGLCRLEYEEVLGEMGREIHR